MWGGLCLESFLRPEEAREVVDECGDMEVCWVGRKRIAPEVADRGDGAAATEGEASSASPGGARGKGICAGGSLIGRDGRD